MMNSEKKELVINKKYGNIKSLLQREKELTRFHWLMYNNIAQLCAIRIEIFSQKMQEKQERFV